MNSYTTTDNSITINFILDIIKNGSPDKILIQITFKDFYIQNIPPMNKIQLHQNNNEYSIKIIIRV